MQICAQARRGSIGGHRWRAGRLRAYELSVARREHGSPAIFWERVERFEGVIYARGKARAVNKVTTLASTVSADRTVGSAMLFAVIAYRHHRYEDAPTK